MNIEKIKAVHETICASKERMNSMMNEAWFSKDEKSDPKENSIMSLDQVVQLTKVNKNYFLKTLQMMVDILRLQYNRKYIEDFGQPRSANYVFEYDPNIQEITLYVSLKIRGVSNNFLYQTSTAFRMDTNNKIQKAIGNEYLFMLALIGSNQQIHSKDSVREIINSLGSSSDTGSLKASKVKSFYRSTSEGGPAQGIAAKQATTNDNTIRL